MTPVRDIVHLEHFTPQNAKTQLRDHSCTISQKANYSIVNLRNKWMRTYSCAGPHPQRNRIFPEATSRRPYGDNPSRTRQKLARHELQNTLDAVDPCSF